MEIDTFDEEEKNKIISEIANEIIEENEKKALVKIRINQSVYRKKLLKRYNKCCLCPVKNKDLLVASHIKPWAVSDSNEKMIDYI